MKKFIYFLAAMLFLLMHAQAQQVIVNTMANEGQVIPLKTDEQAKFKCFVGKQVADTAYLMWKVQDMCQSGTFIIYRSDNGREFNIVGTKKAIGVPVHNEIAYYIKDAYPRDLRRFYRIVYLSESSQYLLSDMLMMKDQTKTFAEAGQNSK